MMKSFSLNSKKKKDIEKQKKLAEEEACAEAYEEFVATFEAPKSHSKLFVRGNVINPSSGQELSATHSGKFYKPNKLEELERQKSEQDSKRSENKKQVHHSGHSFNEKPPKKKSDVKKKSNLEIFKEELKMLQEEREERHRQRNQVKDKPTSLKSHDDDNDSGKKGSHDTGDPNTTNIYLGNLNPKMKENQLCEIFGRYGPLASVKIMWPRSEEERIRNRNCGFVAFMCRKDGERALKAINGRMIMDYEMRLGWGKAVPIPSTPIYIPPALRELTMPPPPSGLPFNAQIIDEKDKELLQSYGNDPQKLYRENKEAFDDLLSRAIVKVIIPQDRSLVCLIHRVVEFVVREGPMFEALLMNRELNNPTYAFLFENQSSAHIYYRWRLFSVLQGDHPSRWRTNDFRMFAGGSYWRPPPLNLFQQGMPEELLPNDDEYKFKFDFDDGHSRSSVHSNSSADLNENDSVNNKSSNRRDSSKSSSKGHHLSKEDREELEDMLRALNPQRSKIGQMMMFCIEHADSWEEIVECITDSLCINETPLYKKIARLFLVSDILHNCSVKVANVSNYRKGFQSKLNDIFESFHQAYNQIEGRLKAEHFKQRVMNCFRAWEDTAIYSSDFLIKLQNIFLGLSSTTPMKKEENKSLLLKNVPVNNVIAEDIDGLPMIDPDLDGVEMKDEHIAEMNDDDPFRKKFKTSKWETVDPEHHEESSSTRFSSKWETQRKGKDIYVDDDNEEEAGGCDDAEEYEDIDGKPLDEDDYLDCLLKVEKQNNKTGSEQQQQQVSNLSREVLREIELKVVKYQDELESNVRSRKVVLDLYESISQLVEKYRRDLLTKASANQKSSPQSSESSLLRSRRSKSRSRSRSPKSRTYSTHYSKRRSKSPSKRRR